MRPIDSILKLQGLHLTIFLHFQNPDEMIGNRDDNLYIERLRTVNKGATLVTVGNDSGHCCYHPLLWKNYREFRKNEQNHK